MWQDVNIFPGRMDFTNCERVISIHSNLNTCLRGEGSKGQTSLARCTWRLPTSFYWIGCCGEIFNFTSYIACWVGRVATLAHARDVHIVMFLPECTVFFSFPFFSDDPLISFIFNYIGNYYCRLHAFNLKLSEAVLIPTYDLCTRDGRPKFKSIHQTFYFYLIIYSFSQP